MRTTGRKRWERERQSKTGRKRSHDGGRHSDPPKEAGPARKGNPATRYENDPLKGDKRAHLIVRKARQNWKPRKIAKFMDMPLKDVREILERAERGAP